MFYDFNNPLRESLSFYGLLSKGHQHRNEKGYTDTDPNYNRKHLNMVPKYVQKSQFTAVEKIRSMNYGDNTYNMLDINEVPQILKKYNINLEKLKQIGQARLGRSKTIIVYNPAYGNFYLKKEVQLNEK